MCSATTAVADLVRRDRNIPGLGLLLDSAALLDALNCRGYALNVEAISPNYLRYKAGMNCLVRYELSMAGKLVTGYAKAHGADADAKLSKAIERPMVDGVSGPGRMILAGQKIIVSTFPNDAKLPSLLRLGDDSFRRRIFGRVFDQDPNWHGTRITRVLNYKPERRFVARITAANGASALTKFYTNSGFLKARGVSRKLYGDKWYRAPQIAGMSKKHAVIAYHWLEGSSLRDLLNERAMSKSDIASMAIVLAEFHASKPRGLVEQDLSVQARRLKAIGDQVGWLLPHLKQRATILATEFAEWLGNLKFTARPIHGDFYDKQVVVNDGEVILIDLDAVALGNPLADLGSYVAHLYRHQVSDGLNGEEVEMQQKTLVSSYESAAGKINAAQLKKYTGLSLFSLLHHPFRDWSDDWPEQTEKLLERVESLFLC
jgi:tRNA A-37 threonylcarbamoyl transferase component Bud32